MLSSFHSSGLGRDWFQWVGSSDGIYFIKTMKSLLSLAPPRNHEGKCGVGGVLRDAKGSILMEFSLSIGVGSALLADILAIKLAVEHFVNSPWVNRSRLIVESDSKVVVDWVSNPSLLSPFFLKFVQGISSFFTDGRCSIRHIQRVQNVSADILAKVGID
ncbi:hypothetical protein V6N12_069094 [Hibiscus sabdariffa]|uniref:RNase H type-1 domain-containing protein n=1 Tax=Hibiscus sabdariffa TaxID=183260 RepID=A0ABR2FCY3_9ROSI